MRLRQSDGCSLEQIQRGQRKRPPHHCATFPMPHRAGSYQDRTSLMREIRREGVDP